MVELAFSVCARVAEPDYEEHSNRLINFCVLQELGKVLLKHHEHDHHDPEKAPGQSLVSFSQSLDRLLPGVDQQGRQSEDKGHGIEQRQQEREEQNDEEDRGRGSVDQRGEFSEELKLLVVLVDPIEYFLEYFIDLLEHSAIIKIPSRLLFILLHMSLNHKISHRHLGLLLEGWAVLALKMHRKADKLFLGGKYFLAAIDLPTDKITVISQNYTVTSLAINNDKLVFCCSDNKKFYELERDYSIKQLSSQPIFKKSCFSFCLSQGLITFVDSSQDSVYRLQSFYQKKLLWGGKGRGRETDKLSLPLGVVQVNGLLIISDSFNNRIVVVDEANGKSSIYKQFNSKKLLYPTCLLAIGAGRVGLSDTNNQRIVILRVEHGTLTFQKQIATGLKVQAIDFDDQYWLAVSANERQLIGCL